jgi:predicted permease
MSDFLQDARHSLRMFLQSPGFTIAAIAALALGIGATTGIFSIVNAVLLKPLPFPDPDRLVMFQTTSPEGAFPGASPTKFAHWRQQTSVVQDVSAYRSSMVNLTGAGFEEQFSVDQVSRDYFRLLGADVVLGRTFSADEDRPGGPKAVVLSHALWTRRFGADRSVLGRSISLSGEPYAVVGVIDARFDVSEFGAPPEAWIPFQLDPYTADQAHFFRVTGRLRPGVTLEQAQARLKLSAADYTRRFPNALSGGGSFSVERLQEIVVRVARPTLLILLGAVAFVLLIACANVANLLLVRATARRREIAIRAAIGAGRGRIVRQLLTESVLLSVTGGILGLGLGVVAIRALLAINTADLPRLGVDGSAVSLDWRVLLFAAVVSLATGVLFGLVPALQASRADLGATIKESGSRSGTGLRQGRTRAALVVAEVGLALVLLVGSALLVRTAVALRSVNPGFDGHGVLTMRMSMLEPRYKTTAGVEAAVRDGVERLRSVPGVVRATAACCVPLEGGYGLPFVIVGRPLTDGPFHGGGGWLTVSPGYFEVFRIPVRRGRTFTDRDTANAPPVAIINDAMARQYWPKGDPLSERLIIGRGVGKEFASEGERQIVGIVADIRDGGLNDDPGPTMYIPQAQMPDGVTALNAGISPLAWIVRMDGNPFAAVGPIREALRQATGLPVSEIRTMDQVVERSLSRQRFNMWLMTVFGAAALALAAIGIYGLIAYSVEQRNQEIGIRLALGATPGQVKQMVVSQGMRLVVVGLVLGVAAAAAFGKVVASLLYGVSPWDPITLVGAPLVLAAVAFLATWLPARRASRVDPMEALRYE